MRLRIPDPVPMKPFVITRLLDAPRDLVFKVWTEPQHLEKWWGSKGCKVRMLKLNLLPGGLQHYSMRTEDGNEMWGRFIYQEVFAPERLVGINSFSDEAGEVTHHPLSPHWPLEMLSVFTFEEQDGKTLLRVEWLPYQSTERERRTFEEGRESMKKGWAGTLDQLEDYLSKL